VQLHSEEDFLQLIDQYFPETPGSVLVGRGDDCCILPGGSNLCLSTDLFLEDVHFRRHYFSPEEIGYKALAVNISDVAGMGGVPKGFTLELMIPDGLPEDFWPSFFRGMSRLADQHGLTLAGGDLSRSRYLGIGLTIWGEPGASGRLLTRGNARPGDLLFTVGAIGKARTGLHALEEFGAQAANDWPQTVQAHLHPIPRVAEGLILADIPGVRGCMDISDGLARDLPRFLQHCAQSNGAELDFSAIQHNDELLRWTHQRDQDPDHWAWLGGEDYGLLGACSADARQELEKRLSNVAIIGTLSTTRGIRLNGISLKVKGFDHFDSSPS
jgi:thiamine-monophosphate kinase